MLTLWYCGCWELYQNGDTLLMFVSNNGQLEIVQLLLKWNADVMTKDAVRQPELIVIVWWTGSFEQLRCVLLLSIEWKYGPDESCAKRPSRSGTSVAGMETRRVHTLSGGRSMFGLYHMHTNGTTAVICTVL